jgi:hypothetical protein
MTSTLSSRGESPQPHPSLPPSPTASEVDLGQPLSVRWEAHEEDEDDGEDEDEDIEDNKAAGRLEDGDQSSQQTRKEKMKLTVETNYAEGGTDEALREVGNATPTGIKPGPETYPPVSERESETRRIEEVRISFICVQRPCSSSYCTDPPALGGRGAPTAEVCTRHCVATDPLRLRVDCHRCRATLPLVTATFARARGRRWYTPSAANI